MSEVKVAGKESDEIARETYRLEIGGKTYFYAEYCDRTGKVLEWSLQDAARHPVVIDSSSAFVAMAVQNAVDKYNEKAPRWGDQPGQHQTENTDGT